MNQADIAEAREKLTYDLKDYLERRDADLAQSRAAVASRGSAAAAGPAAAAMQSRHTTVSEGAFLEATNRSDDKAPVNFLERGLRASRAVCRIIDGNRTPYGTGFLIGPGLVMTNHHVLPDEAASEGCLAEFDYEEDADEQPLRSSRFLLEPSRIFVSSPQDACDFSIVAVSPAGTGGEPLAARGWLPLDERVGKILEGQPIVIIQHPEGQLKQICLFDSVLRFRDDVRPYLIYTTDTLEGSSGSPCFNRFWQVVGLHHAAIESAEIERGRPVVYNRGIRISSIFRELREGRAVGASGHADAVLRILDDPTTRRNGRPFATAAAVVVPSVSHGGVPNIGMPSAISPPAVSPLFEGRPTVVRVRQPATHLDDRSGYAPEFLIDAADRQNGDTRNHPLYVPLPTMPDWLQRDTVRLTADRASWLLHYQHYSLALSKSRRQAIFTAANVDGARLQNLGRKDRDPDHPLADVTPEAASDIWFYDPRIAPEDQLGPKVYDMTSFDFGHLVRRLDTVWGDDRTARIANDDTFYMTNCSPQESRFHRTRKNEMSWSKLEDKVLGAARGAGKRFMVLTGPVLDPRDPDVGGVKIPTAFWKIAAFERQGRLAAYGFMLWQVDEVRTMEKPRLEGLHLLEEAEEPMAIREIARLTSLDFGPLLEADVLSI